LTGGRVSVFTITATTAATTNAAAAASKALPVLQQQPYLCIHRPIQHCNPQSHVISLLEPHGSMRAQVFIAVDAAATNAACGRLV
jgi:hypothetical protein